MPKFYLSATDEDGTVSKKEFETDYLQDVVDKTSDFLAGVGYCFGELVTTPSVESTPKLPNSSPIFLAEEDKEVEDYYSKYLSDV